MCGVDNSLLHEFCELIFANQMHTMKFKHHKNFYTYNMLHCTFDDFEKAWLLGTLEVGLPADGEGLENSPSSLLTVCM